MSSMKDLGSGLLLDDREEPYYDHTGYIRRRPKIDEDGMNTEPPIEDVLKSFNPNQPRDDWGRWVKMEAIAAAADDPKFADELRSRVTGIEERDKLDSEIEKAKRGRKPIYLMSYKDYLAIEKDKELAKRRLEYKQEREKCLSLIEQVKSGVMYDDRGNKLWPLVEYENELEFIDKSMQRRIALIESDNAYNWEGTVAAKYEKAVRTAYQQGKEVPLDNLVSFRYAEWMKEDPDEMKERWDSCNLADENSGRLKGQAVDMLTSFIKGNLKEAGAIHKEIIGISEQSQAKVAKLIEEHGRYADEAGGILDEIDKIKARHAPGLEAEEVFYALPNNHPDKVLAKKMSDRAMELLDRAMASMGEVDVINNKVKEDIWSKVASGKTKSEVVWSDESLASPKATEFIKKVLNGDVFGAKIPVTLHELTDADPYGRHRAFQRKDGLHVARDGGAATLIHELGHQLEIDSEADILSKAFLLSRTNGAKAKHFGKGYKPHEVYLEDSLYNRYAEKWYTFNASEVVSVGMEQLYSDPAKFAVKSPDHFKYTVAFLRGDFLTVRDEMLPIYKEAAPGSDVIQAK